MPYSCVKYLIGLCARQTLNRRLHTHTQRTNITTTNKKEKVFLKLYKFGSNGAIIWGPTLSQVLFQDKFIFSFLLIPRIFAASSINVIYRP
jgi:hypothetical protein